MPRVEIPSQTDMNPPFHDTYRTLIEETKTHRTWSINEDPTVEESEMLVIDLQRLRRGAEEKDECKKEIAMAARDWGFFQVVNHGISSDVLKETREEVVEAFRHPFAKKVEEGYLNLPVGSYRWGNPTATCLAELSWSEAFHFPASDVCPPPPLDACPSHFSSTLNQYIKAAAALAQNLADVLAEQLGIKSTFFLENCSPSTCYLRVNRYPPCSLSRGPFGFIPHTDSDFLTILSQDHVGGLHLLHNGTWFSVKPVLEALVVNIGDLFQAWSNDVYKSVQHRVMTNPNDERFSIAYLFCPSHKTMIQSSLLPCVYKNFSFSEYSQQVQEDVQQLGNKVGLSRFLA